MENPIEKAKQLFVSAIEKISQGDFSSAEHLLTSALEWVPDRSSLLVNLCACKIGLKKLDEAQTLAQKTLLIEPNNYQAFYNLALIDIEFNRPENAIPHLLRAVEINNRYIEALFMLGNLYQDSNQFNLALERYQHILNIQPDLVDAIFEMGTTYLKLKDFEQSIAGFNRVIELSPNFVQAYVNRCIAENQTMRFDQAIESASIAIQLNANDAQAYFNKGAAEEKMKRIDDAVRSYEKAIEINPQYAKSHYNLGLLFEKLDAIDRSLACYQSAIVCDPTFAEAYLNCANIECQLKNYQAALDNYDRAIEVKNDFIEAHINRGNVLHDLSKIDEAIAAYQKAISINPQSVKAYVNLGNLLQECSQLDEALVCFKKAADLSDSEDYLGGLLLNTQMKMCDWFNFDLSVENIKNRIALDQKVSEPFACLSFIESAQLQLKASKKYVEDKFPLHLQRADSYKKPNKNKICIGYFSADFNQHAVSFLTAEIFELHNKSEFEIHAFCISKKPKDEMTSRLMRSFDFFHECQSMSDQAVVDLARQVGIDIAIDLTGLTGGSRTGIFARRAAPIQINYLGFPSTMGAPFIDYIIADAFLIPDEMSVNYSEKIINLPCFQSNDRKKKIAENVFKRADLHLPEPAFVYCCFNNNYKVTPSIFSSWMRILKNVNNSVLWLNASNNWAKDNLQKSAIESGVNASRIIFAPHTQLDLYLARYRLANLFLDTYPFNGGTTVSDALWAGLPVLTYAGEAFSSRMAGSLLHAVDMPELVTHSISEYESMAIKIGQNEPLANQFKTKLDQNKRIKPLFDSPLLTKKLEEAFQKIYALNLNT